MVFDDSGLKELYGRYGYKQFRMSKFEEYELYIKNRDFLDSLNVITFTDTNGKLMALKPDVTLSIVKNSKDTPGEVRKVFYNENVYRVSKNTGSFQELMQIGLECVGDVDEYNIYEVLMLAAKSLYEISVDSLLDISHLGIINSVVDMCNMDYDARKEILNYISNKNNQGIVRACRNRGIDEDKIEILSKICQTYGKPDKVISVLEECLIEGEAVAALGQLKRVLRAFDDSPIKDILRIDFSVTDDIGYYNGIVFKGFINDVPDKVLSGGQYDKVLEQMGLKSKAIGFAIYTNVLDRLSKKESVYDVDTLIIYDEGEDIGQIGALVKKMSADGSSVVAQRKVPERLRAGQVIRLYEGKVEVVESND